MVEICGNTASTPRTWHIAMPSAGPGPRFHDRIIDRYAGIRLAITCRNHPARFGAADPSSARETGRRPFAMRPSPRGKCSRDRLGATERADLRHHGGPGGGRACPGRFWLALAAPVLLELGSIQEASPRRQQWHHAIISRSSTPARGVRARHRWPIIWQSSLTAAVWPRCLVSLASAAMCRNWCGCPIGPPDHCD